MTNTVSNNPEFIYPNELGIVKLQKYNNGLVWFTANGIPGLDGISPEKLESLAIRGFLVFKPTGSDHFLIVSVKEEDMKRYIEEGDEVNAKNSVLVITTFFKSLNKLILKKVKYKEITPTFIYGNDKEAISNKNVSPYMNLSGNTPTKELLHENRKILLMIETLNNKADFADYLKNDKIIKSLVPEKTITLDNKEALKEYLKSNVSNNFSYPIFIKAGVGASGSGLWKIDSKKKLQNFIDNIDSKGKDFLYEETIFDEEGNILDDIEYSPVDRKWLNSREKDMRFIVQENIIAEFKEEDKVVEKSINYIISDDSVDITVETENKAINGVYIGNKVIELNDTEKSKLLDIGKKLKEDGYRGPVGLDFFSDGENVKVIEANPRNTGATNPAIFVCNLSRNLNTRLEWMSDTLEMPKGKDILEYEDLLFTKEKGYGIVPQTFAIESSEDKNTQFVIFIYKDDEELIRLIKEVKQAEISILGYE